MCIFSDAVRCCVFSDMLQKLHKALTSLTKWFPVFIIDFSLCWLCSSSVTYWHWCWLLMTGTQCRQFVLWELFKFRKQQLQRSVSCCFCCCCCWLVSLVSVVTTAFIWRRRSGNIVSLTLMAVSCDFETQSCWPSRARATVTYWYSCYFVCFSHIARGAFCNRPC